MRLTQCYPLPSAPPKERSVGAVRGLGVTLSICSAKPVAVLLDVARCRATCCSPALRCPTEEVRRGSAVDWDGWEAAGSSPALCTHEVNTVSTSSAVMGWTGGMTYGKGAGVHKTLARAWGGGRWGNGRTGRPRTTCGVVRGVK